ncbi:calcium sensing receptor [Quercus suber]|uniref:Calcium sensing receptor n=1 Tax=Quercus suber TaxID=58331 RepID=A0AAW0M9V1_QUESU
MQISLHGLRSLSPFQKDFELRCIVEDSVFLGLPNGNQSRGEIFKTQAIRSFYSNSHSCLTKSDYLGCKISNVWSSSIGTINERHLLGRVEVSYIENSSTAAVEEEFMDLMEQSPQNSNILLGPVEPETISTTEMTPEYSTSVSESLDMNNDTLLNSKTSIDDFLAGVNKSLSASVNKGENVVKSSLDAITSSITSITKRSTAAVDNAISGVFSTADQSRELAGNRLTSFSSDLKEAASKASVVTVDVLRRTIVAVEDSLTNGTSFIVYSYGSAKERLPPNIRDALNLSEERAIELLRPVRTAFQQVYIAIEGLEKNLGLDPSDPIVPFVLLLGTSTTLWVFYWVWTYSGYSGDLSPKITLEILTGKENAVLIDVRPEVLRERDGIPDLRRAARFRYASVALPEVDDSVRKLLKSGRELDDILIAAVIRNLKIVQDRSKVIVIDADGSRSKGIARSLRNLGIKASVLNFSRFYFNKNISKFSSIRIYQSSQKPYLVQGGFQSWVKQGLRVKDLKPETTLSVLNEEAEAILEEIRPSPVQVLGFGVVKFWSCGSVVALYATLEWEKTLQLIGIVGLGQTIFRRVASYEGPEDFKQDVRLLLAPVRVGAQAFSWAAGKLETNRIGLPTSPSSLDVQNRVLQAAAKHGSQPPDTEGIQEPSPESTVPVTENVDLSEA